MIADTFIRRPVTAIVISLILLIVGTISIINLPIGQYPDITPPQVQITGTFTGADAQTVEQTVTTPIETQVNGSPGMTYMQSNSTSDGRTTINAYFDIGTNPNIATLDVQNRVSIATPALPDEIKRLGLTVRKRNPSILMLVAMYSPNASHNVTFVDNYTNVYVRDELLRVPGVGDIFTRADDFSMRIWLKPDKLAQLGLTTTDTATSSNNIDSSALAGRWLLVPVMPSDTAAGKVPELNFDIQAHRFNGNNGCNAISGNFEMMKDALKFDERIISTKMACPGYNEKPFMDNLLKVNRYEIQDSVLTLMFDTTPLSKWVRHLEDNTIKKA